MRNPILITGSHRSGTTWVGRIVAADKSVVYIQEPFNLDSHDKRFDHSLDTWYLAAEYSPQAPQILSAYKRMIAKAQSPWHRARTQTNPFSPIEFLKRYSWAIAEPKRILLKDPIALLSAEWLQKNLGCQVVCMIRNPLAFVGSLVKWNWRFDFNNLSRQQELVADRLRPFEAQIRHFAVHEMDTLDQASLLWNLLHYEIRAYQKKHPDWLFVRHEDLVLAPEPGFREICHYLGMPYTDQMQQALRDSVSGDSGETDSTNYSARDRRDVLDTWKTRLSPDDAARVIHATQEIASSFYNLDANAFV